MGTPPVQIEHIAYNAATQCFEALVGIHVLDRVLRYPCSLKAPITTRFEDAADSLAVQALREYERKAQRHHPNARFDLQGWLNRIVTEPREGLI